MDKKTKVTKSKGEDVEDNTKTFFTNRILKNDSIKTTFYTTVKNLRGECKMIMEGRRGPTERLLYFPLR